MMFDYVLKGSKLTFPAFPNIAVDVLLCDYATNSAIIGQVLIDGFKALIQEGGTLPQWQPHHDVTPVSEIIIISPAIWLKLLFLDAWYKSKYKIEDLANALKVEESDLQELLFDVKVNSKYNFDVAIAAITFLQATVYIQRIDIPNADLK